jgi:hypothetical protein
MRPPDGGDPFLDSFRTYQVALRKKEDGLDSGLMNHDQIALQPAEVEIGIAPLDDERDVDVGRDGLVFNPLSGRFPAEKRPPGKDVLDDGQGPAIIEVDEHPVSDAGQIQAGLGLEEKAAGGFGPDFGPLVPDEKTVPVNGRNPGASEALPRRGGSPFFKPPVEAEILEVHPRLVQAVGRERF